jgi:hypothetical protein
VGSATRRKTIFCIQFSNAKACLLSVSQSGRDLVLNLICLFIPPPPHRVFQIQTGLLSLGLECKGDRSGTLTPRFYHSWGLSSGDLEGFWYYLIYLCFSFFNCLFFCLLIVLCDVVRTRGGVSCTGAWILGGGEVEGAGFGWIGVGWCCWMDEKGRKGRRRENGFPGICEQPRGTRARMGMGEECGPVWLTRPWDCAWAEAWCVT